MLALVLTLLSVGASPALADDHRLRGTLTLVGGFNGSPKNCHGDYLDGSYDDIDRGAKVTVRNAKGRTIAIAKLGEGRTVDTDCRFRFSAKVPDAKSYSVEINGRGPVVVDTKQMERRRWRVAILLGHNLPLPTLDSSGAP